MRRHLLDALLTWKARPKRKPLVVDSARQTGKTYLLKTLLGQAFSNTSDSEPLMKPA